MKSEYKGIFVIQYKNFNGYKPYLDDIGLPTLDVNNAKLFETRTEAYRYMHDLKLDKECFIEELKV